MISTLQKHNYLLLKGVKDLCKDFNIFISSKIEASWIKHDKTYNNARMLNIGLRGNNLNLE